MRKYGSSKRNPNPPWPCEQSVVVVPPGSNAASVGRMNEPVRAVNKPIMQNDSSNVLHSRDNQIPIMGYMQESMRQPRMQSANISGSGNCDNIGISGYLCQKVGNYARVEFLFGDNMHVEKTGILETVGKDFIVLSEVGTQSRIVCSVKNIKFINIYNLNNN